MVEIEVDMAMGVPGVVLVGLPDAVVRQSVDRVRAAITNAGATWPQRRITIGLSPASMPKQGSGFDLAVAAAVLAATSTVPAAAVERLAPLGGAGRGRPGRRGPRAPPPRLAPPPAGPAPGVLPPVHPPAGPLWARLQGR